MRTERVEPIKPRDILDNLEDIIHPAVIMAVNQLLKENFRGGDCTIKQKEIAARAASLSGVTSEEIYKNKWMDFEPIFERAGWKVTYDKPGYNESYDAYFVFKAKK